jgi:hypothetical protein
VHVQDGAGAEPTHTAHAAPGSAGAPRWVSHPLSGVPLLLLAGTKLILRLSVSTTKGALLLTMYCTRSHSIKLLSLSDSALVTLRLSRQLQCVEGVQLLVKLSSGLCLRAVSSHESEAP